MTVISLVRQCGTCDSCEVLEFAYHILIAGNGTDAIAKALASIHGVELVVHANASYLTHPLAEDVASLVVAISGTYE